MSLFKLLNAAQVRLEEAKEIADSLRHNKHFHQLAMRAVFVLEDCVFELTNIVDPIENAGKDQRGSQWR